MRLAATAIGTGVPDSGLAGTVVCVYQRICLLGLSDQILLTLATSSFGHLPRGISLDSPSEFLPAGELAAGREFAARGGVLRFSGSTLSVDMRGARRWRCDLAGLKIDINRTPVLHAWNVARAELCRDRRSHVLLQVAGRAVEDLLAATRRLVAAEAAPAVFALVGLGEGSTPAGDDFLVGYIAGLMASAGAFEPRIRFVSALCEQLKASVSRTPRVSAMYLEAAAEGQVSERLYTVAMCIAAGTDEERVIGAVRAALAVGHSSGASGVLGMVIGCTAWRKSRCAASDRRFWGMVDFATASTRSDSPT